MAQPQSRLAHDLFERFVPSVRVIPRGDFDSQLRIAVFGLSPDNRQTAADLSDAIGRLTPREIRLADVTSAIESIIGPERAVESAALQALASQRIPVLFATSRRFQPEERLGFGSQRGTEVSYGVADVSIPDNHRYGHLETPNIWKFEFRDKPSRDVVVTSADRLRARSRFGARLDRLSAGGPGNALVFVHGFNVSFEDALKRVGQICYDLHFDGVPLIFSWPSKGRGGPRAYEADGATAGAAQASFNKFLEWLLDHVDLQAVHLLAHSMGTRLATNALMSLRRPAPRPRIANLRQIVLAAPDVDEQEFRDRVAAFNGIARRVTMYASIHDKALWASGEMADHARAGSSGPTLVAVPGLDTIDVSTLDTDFTGHSYYGNNPTVLTDMYELINKGTPPERRSRLHQKKLQGHSYWQFQP